MNYDIIALDVDGTLLTDDHVLTKGTIEVLQQAAARGAEIVLCTGRGPAITIPILEQMGLSGTIITHNGGATVDSASRKVVSQFSFGLDEVALCLNYCREQGVHFDLNTAFDLYIERYNEAADTMYSQYGASPILLEQGTVYPEGLVKMCLFGTGEVIDTVESHWERWSGGMQFIRSGDYFIDVMQKDVHKGRALEELARMRGIERSRIMAIGNYYNDIGMLQAAGLGIAMDNSPDRVKAEADAVTLSNNEEGVRHALQTYL
ncbi:Cof-type HAD-IIB family hydrolase [Paenibacillus pinihumi]|uniref:Cof-type HAD-IIB family hydrolase n=1 Tax=Paenibacillus pinihumi TaxID=669462 RepID=UPI00041FE293|nr:Cof-type HAD-IIB family hydrolase [Paenibacillus pinihumi]